MLLFLGVTARKKPDGIFLAVGLSALSFFVLKERTKKGCRANPSRKRTANTHKQVIKTQR